ncbi:hypothetical protein [Leucobacter salsicius]|uniref:hypothetical protein n=1 Tax=Leucobacter salsicius TaxID=664638 RepID=UPI0012F8BBCA|nr:hypothetical protein [Leucobacter salsicius]
MTQLQEGQIRFADLPLSVSAWYFAGLADGRASRQLEVDRLEREANILWMRAFAPKERHAEYQRRLDEHFRLDEQAFFDALEAQHNPAHTIGQPQNVNSIRAGQQPAETGVNDGSSAAPERSKRTAA